MKSFQAISFVQKQHCDIPNGKRVPFGADYACVPSDGSVLHILFPQAGEDNLSPYEKARLRFVCALDVRENRIIEVSIIGEGSAIGILDIRFAYCLQPFDLEVEVSIAQKILKKGVALRMTRGENPTFFFFDATDPFLTPALMFDDVQPSRRSAFSTRLYSLSSIQPFGWMEGCVLDGLSYRAQRGDTRALDTINLHLGKYVVDGILRYEDPRSNIHDGSVYGIECCLPFALMAKHEIGTENVQLFKEFIESKPLGQPISDDDFLSAEGCYTIAYPLALIGRVEGNATFCKRAVDEILFRADLLREDDALYLRYKDGERMYKNWGRAFAWYLLGIIQVMIQLQLCEEAIPVRLREEYTHVLDFALSHLHHGLLSVFITEYETGAETSATAGVGAAVRLGIDYGFLDASYEEYVHTIVSAIEGYLTPDGMLGGVSQSNRDGERLQRSGYRVISQMAMGLLAHCM